MIFLYCILHLLIQMRKTISIVAFFQTKVDAIYSSNFPTNSDDIGKPKQFIRNRDDKQAVDMKVTESEESIQRFERNKTDDFNFKGDKNQSEPIHSLYFFKTDSTSEITDYSTLTPAFVLNPVAAESAPYHTILGKVRNDRRLNFYNLNNFSTLNTTTDSEASIWTE